MFLPKVLASLIAVALPINCVSATHSLPDGNLIVGYAPTCNETQIVQSAEDGVNVIIWFSVNLAANSTIENSLDFECIARVAHTLRQKDLPTAHLISVGGWDAPHPDTSLSGDEWFQVWQKWNLDNAASVPADLGWGGFDGIDWDLEGNDKISSEWNHFTVDCIDLVGTMSQAAKVAGERVPHSSTRSLPKRAPSICGAMFRLRRQFSAATELLGRDFKYL